MIYAAETDLRNINIYDMQTHKILRIIYNIDAPLGMALSPDDSTLYVTNSDRNSINVIETARNGSLGGITVGNNPQGVAVSPDGRTVYVTNNGDNTVSVADAATREVTHTISVGKSPDGIRVNPVNGDVYVVNFMDSTVSVIWSDRVVATIPVGQNPSKGIVVTPDGKKVYVANSNSQDVSVIDTATNTVVKDINTGAYPFDIALSPDARFAYVTNTGDNKVSIIDTSKDTVIDSFYADSPSMIAVRPDNKALYVTSSHHNDIMVMENSGDGWKQQTTIESHIFDMVIAPTVKAPIANYRPTITPTPVPTVKTGGKPLDIQWYKTYDQENLGAIYTSSRGLHDAIMVDDGYVLIGDISGRMYLTRTDLDGDLVWNKTSEYGGYYDGASIAAIKDGYIVAGDLNNDIYLTKIDLNGNQVWNKTYGTPGKTYNTFEFTESVAAVDDGFVVTGYTFATNNSFEDIFLLKTDLDGNQQWYKTYGGPYLERAHEVISVPDGYIIVGETYSYSFGQQYKVDDDDVYLIKTDLDGNQIWNKTYGWRYHEVGNSVAAVDDGYVIVGNYFPNNDWLHSNVFIVKTDLNGSQIWSKDYGGAGMDSGKSIVPAADGYLVSGESDSYSDNMNAYLLKVNRNGDVLWNKTYGIDGTQSSDILARGGDGFAIAGVTRSQVSENEAFYLMKIVPDVTQTPSIEATARAIVTAKPGVNTDNTGTPFMLSSTDIILITVVCFVLVVAIIGAGFVLYFGYLKK